MAGGGFGGGGRRGRNRGMTNLNLVPFIDLFSTLIIFLLATAVWDQLAAVPVSLGSPNDSKVEMPLGNEKDLKKIEGNVKINISSEGVELFDSGKTTKLTREELIASEFSQVLDFSTAMRAKFPQKRDIVLVSSDDAVYEDIIFVMDHVLAQNFDQLIVMGATP